MAKKKLDPQYRTTYRFVGGRKGRISKINFESLKKGDYFFMENPNGDVVADHQGLFILKALSKVSKCPSPTHPSILNYIIKSKWVA